MSVAVVYFDLVDLINYSHNLSKFLGYEMNAYSIQNGVIMRLESVLLTNE